MSRLALKIEPDNILANLRYGKICQLYIKDYKTAMECYQRIIHVDPQHFKAYYQMGLIHLDEKRYKEAQENFKSALKANPDFSPGKIRVGSF